MLSMIQHGPYDASHEPSHGLERSALDRATAGRVSEWLSRMERLSLDTVAFERRAAAERPGYRVRLFRRSSAQFPGRGAVDLATPRAAFPDALHDQGQRRRRRHRRRRAGAGSGSVFPGRAPARSRRRARRTSCSRRTRQCDSCAAARSSAAAIPLWSKATARTSITTSRRLNFPMRRNLANEPGHMGSLPSLATRRRPKAGT